MQPSEITFTAFGDPVSQGSKNCFFNKALGRCVVVESSDKRLKAWRKELSARANEAADEADLRNLYDDPLEVRVKFWMPTPEIHQGELWASHALDLDKMCRGAFDALNGAVLRNDARVCRLVAEKVYATRPGALIRVSVL